MATWTQPPIREIYKQTPDEDLALFRFMPDLADDEQARGAVVLIVCGGWNNFEIDKYLPQAAYLTSRGLVGIVAEVRVLERHEVSPRECLKDTKTLMRYVRTHAEEYNFPVDKIILAGGSAAGHITLCTEFLELFDDESESDVSCKPNYMAVYNPLVLVEIEDSTSDIDRIAMRAHKCGSYRQLMELSPYRALRKSSVPLLIMTGDADPITTLADANMFIDRMKEYDNHVELCVYKDARHGFFYFIEGQNKYFYETTRDFDLFLQKHNLLDPLEDIEVHVRKFVFDWAHASSTQKEYL